MRCLGLVLHHIPQYVPGIRSDAGCGILRDPEPDILRSQALYPRSDNWYRDGACLRHRHIQSHGTCR